MQSAPVTLERSFRVSDPLLADVPKPFAERATRPFREMLSLSVMFANPVAEAGILTVRAWGTGFHRLRLPLPCRLNSSPYRCMPLLS